MTDTIDFNLPGIDTVPLAESGIDLPLKRVDGSPLLNAKKQPVTLHIFGADSKAYAKASRALSRRRVERASQSKGAVMVPDEQLDASEEDAIDLLVACTSGWSGVLDSKDKDVPFTPVALKVFYTRFPPARDQADSAIVNRTLFITPSSEG